MNYADIKRVDVANGPGIRVSLFVSGCRHQCKNCFNPETWSFQYGKVFSPISEKEVLSYLEPDHIRGLTLLGGDPMEPENQEGLLPLLRKVKQQFPEKTIWCYTGYTFEEDILGDMWDNCPYTREFLSYIDVLVDGEFVEAKKDLSLRFRGSSNQRIILVQESLKEKSVQLYRFND